MEFTNDRVLVLGGSSGIGFAAAKAFKAAGALVTIAARSMDRLKMAGAEIGPETRLVVADVGDPASLAKALAGGFDHVVVSAGVAAVPGPLVEVGADGIAESLTGKALGQAQATLLAAQAVEPGGSVTVVTGVAGRKPLSGMGAVGMANAAIEAMVPVLAAEVGPTRVNAVSPGLTNTGAYAAIPQVERDSLFANAASRLPAGRVGDPADLAKAILAIAANSFITGTVLEVDGGAGLSANRPSVRRPEKPAFAAKGSAVVH